MRKCVIHTRAVQEDNSISPSVLLEPFVHAALYNIPAIRSARKYLSENEQVAMVAIQVGTRCYTVTVITENQRELERYAFELDSKAPCENVETNREE